MIWRQWADLTGWKIHDKNSPCVEMLHTQPTKKKEFQLYIIWSVINTSMTFSKLTQLMIWKRDWMSWSFSYNLDQAYWAQSRDFYQQKDYKCYCFAVIFATLRPRHTQSRLYCWLWACVFRLGYSWFLDTNLKFCVNVHDYKSTKMPHEYPPLFT